jgi:hypothetical protein
MKLWVLAGALAVASFIAPAARGTIFGGVRGIVHYPRHQPIAGAQVTLHARASAWSQETRTNADGEFAFVAVPVGEYSVEGMKQLESPPRPHERSRRAVCRGPVQTHSLAHTQRRRAADALLRLAYRDRHRPSRGSCATFASARLGTPGLLRPLLSAAAPHDRDGSSSRSRPHPGVWVHPLARRKRRAA